MSDLEGCESVSYGTKGHVTQVRGRIGQPSNRATGRVVGIVSAYIEINGFEFEGVEAEAIIGILAVRIPD